MFVGSKKLVSEEFGGDGDAVLVFLCCIYQSLLSLMLFCGIYWFLLYSLFIEILRFVIVCCFGGDVWILVWVVVYFTVIVVLILYFSFHN